MQSCIVRSEDDRIPKFIIRTAEEWGIRTADLAAPPRRFFSSDFGAPPIIDPGVDTRRLTPCPTPGELFASITSDKNISGITRRSLWRFWAYFLICEDPQRRLDAREVSTLSHQVSLVRHILDSEHLRRVLIADEVGLGKTVEAGLLLKELLDAHPRLRVLYLAPARLVSNVRREFDRLKLKFRQWSAVDADARLSDSRIIASIHRAVHPSHRSRFLSGEPWDIIVVDECHHLSDWAAGGGDPREKYRLVRELISKQTPSGRVVLLSGTPHQGHVSRFENLLGLLKGPGESFDALQGRVIFRTKDDIVDWDGGLLFPRRIVHTPIVVDLGASYKEWITAIHEYYSPGSVDGNSSRQRAAGWKCAQALQWAASSPQAGLGYLVRQALRGRLNVDRTLLEACILALRPYRNGPVDESFTSLFARIQKEVQRQQEESDIDDIEDDVEESETDEVNGLCNLLSQGLRVLRESGNTKWQKVLESVIAPCENEKIVFFAQPIETVTAFARFLEQATGQKPSLIVGGQSDAERDQEVRKFCRRDGPQFLVSSRAGGEGINLQVARRLVHIDVPWNPMDMEQRVGRVHRFGSRRDIIVDTLVVKGSREEHAYRVARDRLRLIVSTMVEAERFESLFSRIMCLMPPEELQDVLINGAEGPLTAQDQESVGRLVREGFEKWREFDERYSEHQKSIKAQDAGLATWLDIARFLMAVTRAERVEGFVSEKFSLENGFTSAVTTPADVVRLSDGIAYACCDLGGLPAYGPNETTAKQLGLNLPLVVAALSQAAFPDENVGAASIRWPDDLPFPINELNECVGLLVLLRLSIRFDQSKSWNEHGASLHYFVVRADGSSREMLGTECRRFVDGIGTAIVRTKKPNVADLETAFRSVEEQRTLQLQRPSEQEIAQRIRHAVAPLLACTIERS